MTDSGRTEGQRLRTGQCKKNRREQNDLPAFQGKAPHRVVLSSIPYSRTGVIVCIEKIYHNCNRFAHAVTRELF